MDIHCTICASSNVKFLLSKDNKKSKEAKIFLYRCFICGGVFLGSVDNSFTPELYSYYTKKMSSEKSDLYNPLNYERYQSLLASLKKIHGIEKILDVGCGAGQFVDYARKSGYDILGIDLSESAVNLCQKFKLPVRKADIFDNALKNNSFDLIIMIELLEHVVDPSRVFKRAEELLSPGGLLYLTTPNFSSLDKIIMGVDWKAIDREHLTYFTPKSILFLVKHYTTLIPLYVRTRNISIAAIKFFILRFLMGQRAQNNGTPVDEEQKWRNKIEDNTVMVKLKYCVNKLLETLRLGRTIFILLQKP